MSFYLHQTGFVAESYIALINKLTTDYEKCFESLSMMYGAMMIQGFDVEKFTRDSEAWIKDHSAPDPNIEVSQDPIGKKLLGHMPTFAAIVSSRAVISGDLLQLAKQTISYQYGGKKDWPIGRMVGKEKLSDLILHGRNHSMHFEENRPQRNTSDFLNRMVQDYGRQFPMPSWVPRNMSYELIAILNWTSYPNYETDLKLILDGKP
jgi:hypothetical protein